MYQFVLWSESDIDMLKRMWLEGATARKIGETLKRTPNAIRNQARALELPRRPGGRHGNGESRRGRRFRKGADSASALLRPHPVTGYFDSRAALFHLLEHWRAA